MTIIDNFTNGIDPRWEVSEMGQGRVFTQDESLHFALPALRPTQYANAQITDYVPTQRNFQYRPPLRMTVTARAFGNKGLFGTAGFGFWNHPFVPGEQGFRVPQALWFFFGSPPNNMALALDAPGYGWKAATFNAHRWPFYAMLPLAPIGVLLMQLPPLYRRLWPIGQCAIGVSETHLNTNTLFQEHTYTIEWLPNEVAFFVDHKMVHQTLRAVPTAPLGFIAWLDNQYAIVTPQGQFGFGFVDVPIQQSLVLDEVRIEAI